MVKSFKSEQSPIHVQWDPQWSSCNSCRYSGFLLQFVVISHIKTNLDMSRSFLILLSRRHSCPIHVNLACLTTSHPSVYILMFFLSPLLRLTFLLIALSGLCLINLILHMTNTHTHK